MALSVHFYRLNFGDQTEYFQSLLDPEIQFSTSKEIPTPAQFEVLVYPTPDKTWIEASPNLRAVIIPWAGVPEKLREVMTAYPEITIHNLHHNNFNTAEMGLALLLAAAKRLVPLDQALRRDDWSPRYEATQAILLRGKTCLILGYGEVGRALAGYCHALGMRVIATRKHLSHQGVEDFVEVHPASELAGLLPKADVLMIALPLTAETEDLIGEKELAALPAGGLLVNIGRGPIVNQYALFEALKSGRLRAAASDVWYNYPETKEARSHTPPADVPFGELDNFVLSPHRGGMVAEVERQRAEALAELLNAANRGEPLPNQVDLEAGY